MKSDWCDFKSHFCSDVYGPKRLVLHEESYSKYKKMRVRCPHCKRRMIAKVVVCSVGCCVEYILPPHKTTKSSKWKLQ